MLRRVNRQKVARPQLKAQTNTSLSHPSMLEASHSTLGASPCSSKNMKKTTLLQQIISKNSPTMCPVRSSQEEERDGLDCHIYRSNIPNSRRSSNMHLINLLTANK